MWVQIVVTFGLWLAGPVAAAEFSRFAVSKVGSAKFNHAVNVGRDRMVIVGVVFAAPKAAGIKIKAVTFDGVPMKPVPNALSEVGGADRLQTNLYYLAGGQLPPGGSYPVEVAFTGRVTAAHGGATSVAGVANTVTGFAGGDSSGRDAIALTARTSAPGYVVDVVGNGKTGTFTTDRALGLALSSGGISGALSAGDLNGTKKLGYTSSGANRLAMSAVVLTKLVASAPVVTPPIVTPPVITPPVVTPPTAGGDCAAPAESAPLGWASVSGGGVSATTGGADGPVVIAKTLDDVRAAVAGAAPRVVQIRSVITGSIEVGSNKTILGLCGGTIKGHLNFKRSVNVIVRNLKIVGYNCSDSPSDCSAGEDAITVTLGAHHLWFDHDDVSDGSDGNLDITHGSDFITISWTKFWYSGARVDRGGALGGHQFSNLIGHSDANAAEDTGKLRITFHHDWWADHVHQRAPRVRFGRVHVMNSLYTQRDNLYAVGVGVGANILMENNVFVGVNDVVDAKKYSDARSVIKSFGNIYVNVSGGGPTDLGSAVFTPPYAYALDPVNGVESRVRNEAGTR